MSQKRELSLSELYERDGHHEEAPPPKPCKNVRHLRRQAALLHYSGTLIIRFLLKKKCLVIKGGNCDYFANKRSIAKKET